MFFESMGQLNLRVWCTENWLSQIVTKPVTGLALVVTRPKRSLQIMIKIL
jgi:hypothetical protein